MKIIVAPDKFKGSLSSMQACKAIEAGIYHDLGSGSNVDVVIITRGKVEYLRNYKHDNFKIFSKPDGYEFRKDRVQVLEEFRHKLIVNEGE